MPEAVSPTAKKKQNFYFQAYYERKSAISQALNKPNRKSNVIKFRFEDAKPAIQMSKTIHSYLVAHSPVKTEFIESIIQVKSVKLWEVELNENDASVKSFLNELKSKKESFEGLNFLISGPSDGKNEKVTLTAVLRVFWYPTNGNLEALGEHIAKFADGVKILDIQRETYKDEALKNIKNGIVRIKISYDYESHKKLLNNIGLSSVGEAGVLVQISGHPPKCTFCSGFGHTRRDCDRAKLKCTKCHKSGHLVEQCNMALSTAPEKQLDAGDYEEEEEEDAENEAQLNRPLVFASATPVPKQLSPTQSEMDANVSIPLLDNDTFKGIFVQPNLNEISISDRSRAPVKTVHLVTSMSTENLNATNAGALKISTNVNRQRSESRSRSESMKRKNPADMNNSNDSAVGSADVAGNPNALSDANKNETKKKQGNKSGLESKPKQEAKKNRIDSQIFK